MRTAIANEKPAWSENGLAYVKEIMQANDGSAEAKILITLAEAKQKAAQ